MTLNKLNTGEKGVVTEINPNSSMRQRLIDIGIVRGTKIECVLESPREKSESLYDKRCCYCYSK